MQRRILQIAWPAFLMTGVLEAIVFAVVDPHAMRWFGGALVGASPLAIYSIAFLVFWAVVTASGVLTALLEPVAGEPGAADRGAFGRGEGPPSTPP